MRLRRHPLLPSDLRRIARLFALPLRSRELRVCGETSGFADGFLGRAKDFGAKHTRPTQNACKKRAGERISSPGKSGAGRTPIRPAQASTSTHVPLSRVWTTTNHSQDTVS